MSDIKCPYCNSELLVDSNDVYFKCPNNRCVLGKIFLEKIIIYDLLDGLCAIDALENIVDNPFHVLTHRGYELAKLTLDSRLEKLKVAITKQNTKE